MCKFKKKKYFQENGWQRWCRYLCCCWWWCYVKSATLQLIHFILTHSALFFLFFSFLYCLFCSRFFFNFLHTKKPVCVCITFVMCTFIECYFECSLLLFFFILWDEYELGVRARARICTSLQHKKTRPKIFTYTMIVFLPDEYKKKKNNSQKSTNIYVKIYIFLLNLKGVVVVFRFHTVRFYGSFLFWFGMR